MIYKLVLKKKLRIFNAVALAKLPDTVLVFTSGPNPGTTCWTLEPDKR